MNIKKTFLEKLESLLHDSSQDWQWSSNRFGFLLTVVLSNFCFWFPFLYLSLYYGKIVDVPSNVVTIYISINGVAGAYKYFQKTKEKQD